MIKDNAWYKKIQKVGDMYDTSTLFFEKVLNLYTYTIKKNVKWDPVTTQIVIIEWSRHTHLLFTELCIQLIITNT